MRQTTLTALAGSALLSLAAQRVAADSGHRHLHSKHSGNHTHGQDSEELVKRGRLVNRAGQCAFPEDAGLVAVTPGSMNKGWAMSPDQECTADSYCPIACPPGQLMNQWEPGSSYVYPSSMAGGLYCDKTGKVTKPFPSEDYCVEGVGTVQAVNDCGKPVAFCQTVLPGNEAMLIPTSVDSSAVIAVPGTSYWASTASHFYINAPGFSIEAACAWGDGSEPIGNWAPYVAGANQDATGDTYVKIGYNPIYTDSYAGVKPSFGVKIECDGNCVGLPCSIDPSTSDFGVVTSDESATGAGGADFCVVTVTSGSANIVVFNTDGSTGDDSSSSSSSAKQIVTSSSSTKAAEPKPEPTTSTPKVKVAGLVAVATTSSSASPSTTTTHSSTTSSSSSVESTATRASSSSKASSATSSARSSTTLRASSTKSASGNGGVFQENDDATNSTSSATSGTITSSASLTHSSTAPTAATTSSKSNASKDQAAFAGLVVAIVAAACLY